MSAGLPRGAHTAPAAVPGALSAAALFAYALLGLPLAFVALPIYVHLPKLYADLGLSLGQIGGVLLVARIWDAVIDPLIGAWGDRHGSRRTSILLAVPLLLAGYFGLLAPPSGVPGSGWLLLMLLIVYLGYSLATVNHHAWGAELGADPLQRTRITAAREGCTLLGVLLAAALPGLLAPTLGGGLMRLAWIFLVVLLFCAALLWRVPHVPRQQALLLHAGLYAALASAGFRRLLAVFAVSGIAAAIPASLVLFFVADVLGAEDRSGMFLGIYFLAGAAGLPFWVWLARRRGKRFAWGAGMALAVVVFVWAGMLGQGDTLVFALICALSGLALGADLALPPSLLADLIGREQGGAGSYFGWWNFTAKLNLALAAGLGLPLLGWLGYAPGAGGQGVLALAWVYAGVPAILKLLALALLWRLSAYEED